MRGLCRFKSPKGGTYDAEGLTPERRANLEQREGTLRRGAQIVFTGRDASLYLIPFAARGLYFYGEQAFAAGQTEAVIDFREELRAEQKPKLAPTEKRRDYCAFSLGFRPCLTDATVYARLFWCTFPAHSVASASSSPCPSLQLFQSTGWGSASTEPPRHGQMLRRSAPVITSTSFATV